MKKYFYDQLKSSTDDGPQSTAHNLELQPLFSSVSGEEVKIHESYLISRDNKKPRSYGAFNLLNGLNPLT